MNQNIEKFTKNVKPVSIEDETGKEDNISQKDVVILPGSSDEDSFFGLRSMASKKKKKKKNKKKKKAKKINQIENMLIL